MKPFYTISLFAKAALFLSACSSPSPQDDFQQMIQQARPYPIIRETEIFLSNPFMVAELKKHKLQEQEYIIIDEGFRAQGEAPRPYIRFTDKARPFLVGEQYLTSDGYTALAQRVALCRIDFKGISRIRFSEDKTKAIVLFEEVYRNLSPFANLYAENERQQIREGDVLLQEVYFSKTEEGWSIEAKPDEAFMAAFVAF